MRDGKFVDHYPARDDVGMIRDLGLLPENFGMQLSEPATGPLGDASDSGLARRPQCPAGEFYQKSSNGTRTWCGVTSTA
jgi:hypothetical protein